MKKKYIALLLTILIFGVSGCANKEPVETISTIDEVVEVESSEIIESTEIESSEVIESTEMTSEVEITTEETTTVEETTEIEETETPTVAEMSTKSTEVLFDTPIAMYTTQNCNVRSRADKESELIITLAKDVEIYCWGTDGDWSIVDCQGIKAYIHSTLLTETKPAPAQTTKPAEQSKPSQTQTPAQTTQQKPAETQPQTPSQPSGTITAVTPEGKTVTLRPYKPEKGIYLDETGAARNANGQEVSIITGELYIAPETVDIDLTKPLPSGSGVTAH